MWIWWSSCVEKRVHIVCNKCLQLKCRISLLSLYCIIRSDVWPNDHWRSSDMQFNEWLCRACVCVCVMRAPIHVCVCVFASHILSLFFQFFPFSSSHFNVAVGLSGKYNKHEMPIHFKHFERYLIILIAFSISFRHLIKYCSNEIRFEKVWSVEEKTGTKHINKW